MPANYGIFQLKAESMTNRGLRFFGAQGRRLARIERKMIYRETTQSERRVIVERSELTRSLPARGGWEGRAFNSPFACFIIRGAAPLRHER
jgi:hypothetical protein